MIGIPDEQGLLEEDEVFVQIEYNYWIQDDVSLSKDDKAKLS